MTKTKNNVDSHSYKIVHDKKTYDNMDITHICGLNQLMTYNIHKQITELNKLVNDEVQS